MLKATDSPIIVGGLEIERNPNAKLGLPNGQDVLISRYEYVISYNAKNRIMNWAAWRLNLSDLGSSGRSDDFALDQDLADIGVNAVNPDEYKGSCLDRGHYTCLGV